MDWSVDLPNWQGKPDPEVPGATVWVHTDYDGKPDIALAAADNGISVVENPEIGPDDLDGCELGIFRDWDAALQFALAHLE